MNEPLVFAPDDPRLRRLNDRPVASQGDYVLYWMQMYRRAQDNAALDYAVSRANELGVPCVVYEAVRPDYPHASDRLHTFLLQGAKDNAARLVSRGLGHVFFLPRTPAEARGVLAKLAARARMIVSDDFPSFIIPAQTAAAANRVKCAFVVVDDNAVVPMALLPKAEHAARTLRPKMNAALGAWLRRLDEPRAGRPMPRDLDLPFDPVNLAQADIGKLVASCAVDHSVPPVVETAGGTTAGAARLSAFLRGRLGSYDVDRHDPSRHGTSDLSAYLHFGMLSARHVAIEVRESGASAGGDAFLEQLLVRRGLSFNFARARPDHASWTALPAWARGTLEESATRPKGDALTRDDLEGARSPDPLWNAAMSELRVRGTIVPYARMLWGKLPIGWMASPQQAHAALVHLNDRWALDGRDPNGYANIAWCFGLHDRPWPPRPVFGAVRCMTSASARRKLDFEAYIDRWSHA